MPTFQRTPRFRKDESGLSEDDLERFKHKVLDEFVPDLITGQFRSSLRVRGVQGVRGVFEMTWAGDGRATFQYGPEVRPGHPHIIWRRIGTHAVFVDP
jgi:hypothetical protein